MSEQLTLDLPFRPGLGRGAFFVAPANALALAEIDRWADWPLARLVLVGAAGTGKTHLAHVWAEQTGADIWDAADLPAPDAVSRPLALEGGEALLQDPAGEERLFHLLNAHAAAGVPLLLTGREAPARWPARLPDLRSRLAASHMATLDAPDDTLLAALYLKHFEDRQLIPTPPLIDYLVAHANRSAAAVARVVAALDQRQLATGRKLSARLAGEVLKTLGDDGLT